MINRFLGVKLDSKGFPAMYANQHETLWIVTVLLGKLYQHSVTRGRCTADRSAPAVVPGARARE